MFLIASGAYLGPEFVSEFGLLPPAFLPVGNRRLFSLQREQVAAAYDGPVFMSLPEDFELQDVEREELCGLGIDIIRVPTGISLGESVVYCLEKAGGSEQSLHLLHGDTLIFDLPLGPLDTFSVDTTTDYYSWAEYRKEADGAISLFDGLPSGPKPRSVLSGYFSFSDLGYLKTCIREAGNNFVGGLNRYNRTLPLTPTGAGLWLDFGHMHTYYRCKAKLTTQRAFNDMRIASNKVIKSSVNNRKIEAEANWYRAIPSDVRLFTPQFLGGEDSGGRHTYHLEYLYLSTLSELFVFGRLPGFVWERIFEACDAFLSVCARFPGPAEPLSDFADLYLPKTLARLEAFAEARDIDLSHPWVFNGRALPGLAEIACQAAAHIPPPAETDICVVHGDFCFSNILYDFRVQGIRTIDPRGQLRDGHPSIYGDIRYDLAKLYHSVVGRYDFIVSGYFQHGRNGPYDVTLSLPRSSRMDAIETAFLGGAFAGRAVDTPVTRAICTHLFLSMLPLHSDRREVQDALLANALRLFGSLEGGADA